MEDEIRFEITDEVSFEQREENEWDKEETKFFFQKAQKEGLDRLNGTRVRWLGIPENDREGREVMKQRLWRVKQSHVDL